jgi:hypothetical protein
MGICFSSNNVAVQRSTSDAPVKPEEQHNATSPSLGQEETLLQQNDDAPVKPEEKHNATSPSMGQEKETLLQQNDDAPVKPEEQHNATSPSMGQEKETLLQQNDDKQNEDKRREEGERRKIEAETHKKEQEKREAEEKERAARQKLEEAERQAKLKLEQEMKAVLQQYETTKPQRSQTQSGTWAIENPCFLFSVTEKTCVKISLERPGESTYVPVPAYLKVLKFENGSLQHTDMLSPYNYEKKTELTHEFEMGMHAVSCVETLVGDNPHTKDFTLTVESTGEGLVGLHKCKTEKEVAEEYKILSGFCYIQKQQGEWIETTEKDNDVYFPLNVLEDTSITVSMERCGSDVPALFSVCSINDGDIKAEKQSSYTYAKDIVLENYVIAKGGYAIKCGETLSSGKNHTGVFNLAVYAKAPVKLSPSCSVSQLEEYDRKERGFLFTTSQQANWLTNDPSETKKPFFLLTCEAPTTVIITLNHNHTGKITYLELRKMLVPLKSEHSWGNMLKITEKLQDRYYGITCELADAQDTFTLHVYSTTKVTLSAAMSFTEFHAFELKEYENNDKQWKDPDFIPGLETLGKPDFSNATFNLCPQPDFSDKVYAWLRPHDMHGATDPQLFLDGTDRNDVEQGGIGDCYLISCFSVIAEYRQLIQNLVVSTEEQHKNGHYIFRFFIVRFIFCC